MINIANLVHILGDGRVGIGDNTIIASHVVIKSQIHEKHSKIFRDNSWIAPVCKDSNCWIGAGVITLPGMHIGTGSIIAAQTVVIRDVDFNCIVAGVPAH
jgi:acetyltransferase-like isoleucine patch superfamily enzyme